MCLALVLVDPICQLRFFPQAGPRCWSPLMRVLQHRTPYLLRRLWVYRTVLSLTSRVLERRPAPFDHADLIAIVQRPS